ncbi:MAG: ethanolamine utilization protein EutN [Planctomycetes bacterium]|nr:ethanolamine utilization protein EutN [Planctomycetota bacterium]
MQLALVKGRATSTVKHASLDGKKLLIVLQLDAAGKPGGDPLLVIDAMGAGVGEVVLISSDGKGVRERIKDNTTPVRWFTIGLVDGGETLVKSH